MIETLGPWAMDHRQTPDLGNQPPPGTWTDAIDLKRGYHLLTPNGSGVRVIAVVAYSARTTVHNLTVKTHHTYYVQAGNTPVLVHNCGPMDLNVNQVRDRIATHVTPLHGHGTPSVGTKFASNLSEDDLLTGLVNRLDPSNATGLTNAAGNHQHRLPWQGAGANGENWVEVWISPRGELGGMWPVAGPR
jgi:hypothetical protein